MQPSVHANVLRTEGREVPTESVPVASSGAEVSPSVDDQATGLGRLWKRARETHGAIAAEADVRIAEAMAASSQPQLLIRRAYMLLFGREPTDMQIRFWLIRMQVGLSPADFLSAVAADPMCDAPGAREDLAKLRAAKLAAQVWPNSLLRRMDKVWRDVAGRAASATELESDLDYFQQYRRGLADLPFRVATAEFGAWKGQVPAWRVGVKALAAGMRKAGVGSFGLGIIPPADIQAAREAIRNR